MIQIVNRAFSHKTRRALAARGVTVLSSVLVPDESGTWFNPLQCWSVDDNGTGRVLTLSAVLALATTTAA